MSASPVAHRVLDFWEITSWMFPYASQCLVFSGTCHASACGVLSESGLQILRSIHASRSCDFTALAGVFNAAGLFLQPLVPGSLFGVSRLRVQDAAFPSLSSGP